MARWINFEGKRIKVPDDATDAEIAEILESQTAAPTAQPAGANPTEAEQRAMYRPGTVPAAPGLRPRGATSIDEILARGTQTGEDPSLIESTIDTIGGTLAGLPNLAVDAAFSVPDILQMIGEAEKWTGADRSQWYNKPLGELLFSPEVNQKITDAREGLFETTADVRKTVDESTYQPKYGPGKFMKQATPWLAPPLFAPGKAARVKQGGERLFQLAGDVIAQGALPMGAYNVAKEYLNSDGGAILAALTTGVATSAARSVKSPEAVVARDYRGTTDRTWDDMARLQDEQRALGLDITPAESHAQVTGQTQSGPLQTQRYLEATPIGQLKSGPMMANRGNQVEQGLNQVLDQIAPRPANQHMIGPDVSDAGQRVIEQTRQNINDQTGPLYQAAELDTIPQAEYDVFANDPSYAAALQRLRNHPELGQKYHNQPDNSVAVVDAVTKDLFARGEAASTRSNPEYGPHLGSLQTGAAQTARNAATQASPNYSQALAEQNRLRQSELRNVEEGPVGAFANAKNTKAVGNVMLPPNPPANDVPAMVDAITMLKQETAALPAAARQHIDQMLMDLGGKTRSASREWLGADLAKGLAGSPAQRARTQTVLETIGRPEAAGDLNRRIEGWQATGKRLPANSATSQNLQRSAELSETLPRSTGKAISSGKLWTLFDDLYRAYALSTGQRKGTEYAFGPVGETRGAAATDWMDVLPEAAKRTGLATLYEYLTSRDDQRR